jgi:hypothetical protein
VDQNVVLVTSDGHELRVKLKDLSRTGFKVEHGGEDLVIGEIVNLRTSRSEARGQIHWATRNEAGGTFIDVIEPGPEAA